MTMHARTGPASIFAAYAMSQALADYWWIVLLRGLGYAGDITGPGYEYGTAFLLGAGLMNLLLVLDAWDVATGRKE